MVDPTLRRWEAQVALPSAAAATIKAADDATSYIYVTKIRLSILVHANAKATIFRDSTPATSIAQFNDLTLASGTPGGNGTVYWDFGKRGAKLSIGKNFEVLGDSATTTTGYVTAEGYQSNS